MSKKNNVTRLMPQKTAFVDSSFAKTLSGQNWCYDHQNRSIVRRPGTEDIVAPFYEPDLYRSLWSTTLTVGTAVNSNANIRTGICGLVTYNTCEPLIGVNVRESKQVTQAAEADIPTYVANAQTLHALGTQWYRIRDLLAGSMQPLVPHRVETTLSGTSKTSTILRMDTNVSATANPISSNISAFSPVLSGVKPYATSNPPLFRFGESFLQSQTGQITAPYLEFTRLLTPFIGTEAVYSGIQNPAVVNTHVNYTYAQRGGTVYAAGNGSPLIAYDGARASVAGPDFPQAISTAFTGSAGVGVLAAGTYTYRLTRRHYRADGAVIESDPLYKTDDPSVFDFPITVGVNANVTLTIPTLTIDFSARPISNPNTYRNIIRAKPDNKAGTYGVCAHRPYTPVTINSSTTALWSGLNANKLTLSNTDAGAQVGEYILQAGSSGISTNQFGTVQRIAGINGADIYTSDDVGGVNLATGAASIGDCWVLYRTLANGSIFYERTLIPTGTTTYVDNLPDANFLTPGTNIASNITGRTQYLSSAYDRSAPPPFTGAVTVHQQRVVVTSTQDGGELTGMVDGLYNVPACTQLWWSEPSTEYFPASNNISFEGQCKSIIGLASVNDVLYVLTDSGVWTITGTLVDPTTFTLHKISSSYICASAASVLVSDNQVWFVDTNNRIIAISGAEITSFDQLMIDSDSMKSNIQEAFFAASATACEDAKKRKLYFFIPYGANLLSDTNSNTRNFSSVFTTSPDADQSSRRFLLNEEKSVCLMYDKETQTFHKYTGIAANGGATYCNDDVYVCAQYPDTRNAIRRLNEYAPIDANGKPIKMIVTAPFEDADLPHVDKNWGRLSLFTPESEQGFSLSVTAAKDWSTKRYVQQFDLTLRDDYGYGEQPYGSVPYGDAPYADRCVNLNGIKAKSLQLELVNESTTEVPSISGWTLEFSAPMSEGREE